MYEFAYDTIRIDGYAIDCWGIEDDTLIYCWYYDAEQKMHRTKLELCEWAKHLHGNAPSGTRYGRFRIQLPNGKRASYNVYI